MASPTIDGHAHGTANGATSPSAVLTTANAGDTICVFVYASANNGGNISAPKITSISGTGTTGWAQRAELEQVNIGGTGWALSYWTGVAAAALSAVTITATLARATDACAIVAFGVSGATALDPNGGLPVTGLSSAPNTHPTLSVSTSNPDDLLLCGIGVTNFGTALTVPPTGWTLLDNVTNNGGGLGCEIGTGYESVSAIQSGVSVQWGTGPGQLNSNDRVPFIVDAFSASLPPKQYAVSVVS